MRPEGDTGEAGGRCRRSRSGCGVDREGRSRSREEARRSNCCTRRACQQGRRQKGAEPQANYRVRSEEQTSELQSLMRTSYAVFCLKKKNEKQRWNTYIIYTKTHNH